MRIGYLIDVNKGGYDQPLPSPDDAHRTLDLMIEEGIIAERAGFHSIQVPHRHGRTECYFPGPEQLLTILARETDKVAIGTFTYVATLYHPMRAAEQFAIIDNLSKGRLYTTMSRGYHAGYWGQFGIPQEKLLGRFLETIKIWQEAFKGERFDFDGKHWQVEQGLLTPGPYQKGGWPIWGGGNASPEAIKRSATYGEAMTADPSPILKEVWDERVAAYKEAAEERGKKPFVVLMRDGWVSDTFEEAAQQFGTHFVEEWKFYYRQGIFTRPSRAPHRGRHHPREVRAPPGDGHAAAVHRAARALPRGVRRGLLHAPLPDADGAVARGGARADPALRRGGRPADPQEVPGAGPPRPPGGLSLVRDSRV